MSQSTAMQGKDSPGRSLGWFLGMPVTFFVLASLWNPVWGGDLITDRLLGQYERKAVTFFNAGNFYYATQEYSKALAVAPDRSDLLFARGISFYSAGWYQQAIQDYSAYIRKNPTYPQGYYNRALALIKANQTGYAMTDLQIAAQRLNYGPAKALLARIAQKRNK